MGKTTTPKPVAEAILGDETAATPEGALQPLPATDAALSVDAGIMETLSPEPEATAIPVTMEDAAVGHVAASEGEEFIEAPPPQTPYAITELGIQPVALASRTFASDFGPGGSAHKYKTAVYGPDGAIVYQCAIKFQNGALGEGGGINGMADSTLLSILADRWTAFQSGPFASEQTSKALKCIHEAAALLNARTAEREARGVQGKHEE
jgi:hypothetical protein